MISYFDSSVILAILFAEKRIDEASAYWRISSKRVSSNLLKIETIISLRRMYEYNKRRLPDTWLGEKTKELDLYLDGIGYINITPHLERAIWANTDLARCRTLDAIHIATALEVRKMSGDEMVMLYTFDNDMHELAEYFGFQTNRL